MSIALIPMLVCMSVIIVIPILIGVYVYRDAAQRGMNAVLWTLIAVLAPTLIGFIVYLLVRGSYSDLKCPSCEAAVTEQYVVCPKCGTKLKASCPDCGFPIEPDWTVCPKCASPLPENGDDYVTPSRNKDTAIGKILFAVILIPVLLMGMLIVFSLTSSTSSTNMTHVSADNYNEHPEITTWIEKCDEDFSKTYALCYRTERGENKATHYLIYRPSAIRTDSVDTHNNGGLFGLDIEVKYYEGSEPYKEVNNLTCISNYSNKYAGLKVYVNGKKIDCEITDVDFNPALFELISE